VGALAGELLRRDVFPAEVLMPDGVLLSGVRVFVTSHRLLAFEHTAAEGFKQVVCLELVDQFSVPADRGTLPANGRLECRVHLAAVAGEEAEVGTAWVNRGAGCGCGSPLKAMGAPVPWTGA
jgi:hypothetical protein